MEVTERIKTGGPSATREQHSLGVGFGEFGWQALAAASQRDNEAIESLIADACGYFEAELEVCRVATRLPRFPAAHGEVRELALDMPARTWRILEQEAARQSAELARIVEHASLLYLADLESGRAVRPILEAEEAD